MPSSRMTALLGLLAVAGYQNRHRLGDMLGQFTNQARSGSPASGAGAGAGASPGGLQGLLGGGGQGGLMSGLLGAGSPGALLSGGLGELVERFTGSGHGDVARSWVGTGPNQDIGTTQLEQALGEDTIGALTQQTGLSRDELLSRLKTVLPTAVDKLTPDGRIPSEAEASRST
ncbi:MAG: YidB family protein [Gemmatimonas sp.]